MVTRTYTGTDGDNSWTVVQAATFILNGLGGIDTINLGTSLRSAYTIVANPDGSVDVDTVSAASAALHAKFYNVEFLTFNSGTDVLDLRTYFADTSAPQLASSTLPAAGAALAVDASLTFTFSETVKLGSGAIVLKDGSGKTIETFDVANSAGVSISGNSVTLNPTANLVNATAYQLQIGANALVDAAGNAFAASTMAFSTVASTALAGGAVNDILQAGPGILTVDGGAGTDTLVYAMPRASATIARNSGSGSVSVTDAAGSDTLTSVERIAFSDGNVALDIDGVGGQAYRLYQAAFNRVPDAGGLGFWIAQMDKGLSLQDAAAGFVTAAEFVALVGHAPSNRALVDNFYQNVLHRSPDEAGYSYWVGILDSAAATPAQVLAAFSESPENQAALIATIGNGFGYIPFSG